MVYKTTLLSALLFATACTAQVNIVLDDDCATDYCPAPPVFKLVDQGKINLLGLVVSSQNIYAAPVYHVLETYYQHSSVPVYANQQNTPSNANCTNVCNGPGWLQGYVATYDTGDTRANYTDCVTGYRTILATAASSSIVVVNTGFATCLYQLMLSGADGISSLTGVQLIQQKVMKLVACCGVNPTGVEWNFSNDYPSWSYLFANWTSQNGYPPIWLFSTGDASGTNFGPTPVSKGAVSTVNRELAMFVALATNQRPIWDEATVFLAYCELACGGVTYWADAGNGTMIVNSAANTPIGGQQAGYNSWSTGTASGHHYVTDVASAGTLNNLFDGYVYGFGFAALGPLVGTGSAVLGNISVQGAA